MSKSKSKTPPRRQPRTQADCDRAERKGRDQGIELCLTVMLYVLTEKFGFSDEQIARANHWFKINTSSILDGSISFADMKKILYEDYGWEINMT